MQRIYGTAWETEDQLQAYLLKQEEARRRDHRVLGKALDLFSIQEDAGGGLVFWHPKGAIVRKIIEDFWRDEHLKVRSHFLCAIFSRPTMITATLHCLAPQTGYDILYTPHIASLDLWKTSGHFDFYRQDMFQPLDVDGQQFQLKPMNCPFHCLMFKDTPKSYRDLPLRWAELGTVYRYERSGTLHGLFRVRGFTQDDAHIFCLPEQLEDEIVGVLDLVERVLGTFGFSKFEVMLSTRPEQSVGGDSIWERATSALAGALRRKDWTYSVDEGGGAFYGPKIDVKIQDALGRRWQCSTIQCDFNLPERFQLEYAAADNSKQRPIMVHRAIFGSLERFFGVLVESTAGDLPLWLAPVQLRLLPVVDSAVPHCEDLVRLAATMGIRAEVDRSGHRIAKQVRLAEQQKIPVTAVVGAQEEQEGSLRLRARHGAALETLSAEKALRVIADAILNRKELAAAVGAENL